MECDRNRMKDLTPCEGVTISFPPGLRRRYLLPECEEGSDRAGIPTVPSLRAGHDGWSSTRVSFIPPEEENLALENGSAAPSPCAHLIVRRLSGRLFTGLRALK